MVGFFDAQVNYGDSIFGPDCNLTTYLVEARKISIDSFLLIPTGTHRLELEDGWIEESCIWESGDSGIKYKRLLINPATGENEEESTPPSPYLTINRSVQEEVRKLNSEGVWNCYFAPKVHPKLDKPSDLECFVDDPNFKALKAQTLATYCTTEDMPQWLVDFSRRYDKPIIVHTDYMDEDATPESTGINEPLLEIMRKNHANRWAKWSLSSGVRLVLAHGARLDKDTIERVNESQNLIINIGPDSLLNAEGSRLATKTDDYLNDLLRLTRLDKLIFSTDYAWNVRERTDWSTLDWDTPKRIEEKMRTLGVYDPKRFEAIMRDNAMRFFGIK